MNYELQCKLKTTPNEITYRKENCHDISVVNNDDIECTGCGQKFIAKAGLCYVNRLVGTLQCQICYDRCDENKPWKSSNRLHYCIICGKSSNDMKKCCKKDCKYSSCPACILRNNSEISDDTEKYWNCFICSVKQLYPRRAVAAAVMASLSEKSRDQPNEFITKVNISKMKKLNRKKNIQRSDKRNVVDTSSSSDLSSDSSVEHIFQKKITSQKPSTLATPSQSRGNELRKKNTRIDLSNNHDDSSNRNHTNQNEKKNTQLSVTKNKHETMNEIIHNNNNNKSNIEIISNKRVNLLSRGDSSNSSSGKEFSQYKIIPSYIPLRRISNIESNVITSSVQSQSSTQTNNSKQNEFALKNNVDKFLQDMKSCVKKLENNIDHIAKNYRSKKELKVNDAMTMMVECTNMIRDLKEHVNNSEDKVINHYNKWCKKAKIKNIFLNKNSVKRDIITSSHKKCREIKPLVINSSSSDSETTLLNYPISEVNSPEKSPLANQNTKVNIVDVNENMDDQKSTEISDFDERQIFSSNETSNPPSPFTPNIILNNKKTINKTVKNRQLKSVSRRNSQRSNTYEKSSSTDTEIDDKLTKDSLLNAISDKINDKSVGSELKILESTSSPQSKTDMSKNHGGSTESIADMFEDEDDNDKNDKNSSHNKSRRKSVSEKNSQSKEEFINTEEIKSKNLLLCNDSSTDSECDTTRISNKKSKIINLNDEEVQEKKEKESSIDTNPISSQLGTTQVSEQKNKSHTIENEKSVENYRENKKNLTNRKKFRSQSITIDGCDKSLSYDCISINNDTVDSREEHAKKILLDSSSDSDHEISNNISYERNDSLLNDIELNDSDELIKNNTKKIESMQEQLTLEKKLNNPLLKTKRKNFLLINNIHYKNDPKLRMIVSIKLPRLSKNILEQHPNALKLAKEYLENKQIKSLTSIDRIEKRKKKSRSSSSDNDEDSLKRSKKSREKGNELNETEETLMDHLDRAIENIEENNSDEKNDGDTDDSENGLLKKSNLTCLNDSLDNLLSDADNLYKATLLESSHSEGEDNEINNILIDNDPENSNSDNINEKSDNKNKIKNNKQNKCSDTNSDENSIKKNSGDDKAKWKRSKVLTMKFSDTDSEEENRKIEKKVALKMESLKNSDESDESDENDNKDEKNDQLEDSLPIKKKRTRRRRLASDSDVKLTDDSLDSDSDVDEQEKNNKGDKSSDNKKDGGKKIRKRQKNSDNSSDTNSSLEVRKPKAKRKRIRPVSNDSDSDSGNELNSSQGGNKSGRKNIRKVLKDKQVADDTKQAGKLEEERLRRMAERQKLYNEMYEARLATEEKVDKLVLDFDEESKEVLLSVHEKLVKRLKPHQARGIKFMWDAAFESLERAKTTSGSGCILAHCMGLGKSFQVVTLAHTLLSNSEKTGVNTILIVTPLSTVLNWVNEFKIWLSEVENGDDIEIYEMTKCKTTHERKYQLESWQRTGGILMIGYEMFRNLTNATKKVRKNVRESILKCLVDPGADLVICDEGHLLKNEDSAISKAMKRIRTLRRIVLTGTPLQNNLIEYHCMVQFVKPNLLGTKKEFSNRFVNPIQNGQFDDSTEYDVKVMKKRAHVLHKMLEGSVQRYDYSVLTPFLPPKQEYVILVRLTEVQVKLYQYYLDNLARKQVRVGSTLFADFQSLQRIWTHPSTVKSHTEKMIEKRREAETDSEGSLKDFIDDGSDTDSSSKSSSDNDSDVINLDSSENEKKSNRRGTRANPVNEEITEIEPENKGEWWSEFVQPEDLDDMRVSAKLLLLFDIIKECEAIGDKVLVFSQSLYSLTLIEKFLGMIDDETQRENELESLNNHTGSWSLGLDYFRFDGQTSTDNRSHWVKLFNKPSNTRARLFLISTRAGGLGINLTASNRVVIFDASWNPSHDVQSIFRIYRFGQKKPCYIYRLLAAGTMEEKIYNRQVTKLSLSCRVVDEQQIERHFSNNDLAELYTFEPPSAEPPQLALPKDRLIAEIFLKHKNLIETYHEHDSLLENIAAEELDDEERKQAWLEYEQEKAGKRPMPMQMYQNYQQQQQMMMMMQQFNNPMMNLNEINVQGEFTNLLEFIRKDYPHLTEAAQKDMAFRALANMYTYVENQVTTNLNNPANILNVNNPMINNPMVNNQMVNNPIVNNPIVNPIANNPTATLANALAQQEYTRQHSSKYKQQQQQQMQYAQKFGNNVGNIPPAVRPIVATSRGDDIIEIPPSSSRTNVTLPPSNSTKSQEE